MSQAILTTYHGPTNARGSRIGAKANAGRVSIERDSALSTEANHDAAARALCVRFGWSGRYVRGGLPNEKGFVYVKSSDDEGDGFTVEDMDFVEDLFLSATTYSELYARHLEMARSKLSLVSWCDHVRDRVRPAWGKAAHSSRRPNLPEVRAVAVKLRDYYELEVAEGA